ncbi:prephenate dehydrogenase [Planotetraspora kaengkrachanensis]|uniref:Prephenate dehydrogenase n=1 Tax=Planotetraspora kaengkrachanensis TaxID=575193 RepID=A0A8J3LSR5_9ACTN|nr:prephenate dehydrogenase [Planotetraspora kaengkrachanensis]GIG76919.1 prephenate dehydrogenase [Planotetraspora kaengkrachanensis]
MTPIEGATIGSAVVVGTGLIGTSIALALRQRGVRVFLADRDAAAVRLARELGAGEEWPSDRTVDLAIIAVPPRFVAQQLLDLQKNDAARVYTDVASVKVLPLEQAAQLGCDLSVYVAGHPLAGRERSGPAAARADLFLGRPWALCPSAETTEQALETALELVELCGGNSVRIGAEEHDRAVAVISHAPHVTAAAVAAQLSEASETALGLSGQGVRDVTRIAAGDPSLWTGILAGNAGPVAEVLEALVEDLSAVARSLRAFAGEGTAVAGVTDLLERGVRGTGRIPGKHGGPARTYTVVQVVIGDRPGELARLVQAAGETGVNIEDIRLEHAPGLPLGAAELYVQPEAAAALADGLRERGWHLPA